MDTNKIAEEISDELVRIWNEFETKEEFYNCTEDGVVFDLMKCTERRVSCLGSSVLYSFKTAEKKLYKIVLLDAFSQALLRIHQTAKDSKAFVESENYNIHLAGISTLKDIATHLADAMD